MIQHPVERRGTKNAVKRVAKRKREQISSDKPRPIAELGLEIASCMHHHVARHIEPDHSAPRQILQQKPRQLARTASRIQDALVAPQVQLAEHPLSPLELGRGQAVIFRCVPLPRIGRRLRHQQRDADQLDCRQRLVKIGEDIVRIFYPDRNAHHAVRDTNLVPPFFADCGMRHSGRMRNQSFHSTQRLR